MASVGMLGKRVHLAGAWHSRVVGAALICVSALALEGCAQVMAYNQPSPLDRSILARGVDRSRIIGVLGPPVGKDSNADGTLSETYKYVDGGAKNSFGAKAGRMLLYTAGDVFTACLDQVIWMPIEIAFKGSDYTCDITYEKAGRYWVVRDLREISASDQKVVRDVEDDLPRHARPDAQEETARR